MSAISSDLHSGISHTLHNTPTRTSSSSHDSLAHWYEFLQLWSTPLPTFYVLHVFSIIYCNLQGLVPLFFVWPASHYLYFNILFTCTQSNNSKLQSSLAALSLNHYAPKNLILHFWFPEYLFQRYQYYHISYWLWYKSTMPFHITVFQKHFHYND